MTAFGQRTERPGGVSPALDRGQEEISFLGALAAVLRHRALVLITAVLTAGAVVTAILLMPRTYTSESSFMPQAKKTGAGLSGLAAQFGFALATGDAGQSPAFYADLATSRSLLGPLVDGKYRLETRDGVVEGTLVQYYKSKGATPALRRDAAIRSLKEDIEATTVQKTGLVNLAVTMKQAPLAFEINQRLLALLNEFNLHTRQSQAAEERRFTERRLSEVRQDLRAAEDRLQQFLQRNRDVMNSPELQFQRDRLQREVLMQQEVFTTLAQALEQAKIEEVRDTPVLTTVQLPDVPVRPDRRGVVLKGFLALVAGLSLGAVLALWRSFSQNAQHMGSPQVAEFLELRRELATDLRHPWRALGRAFRGSSTGLR